MARRERDTDHSQRIHSRIVNQRLSFDSIDGSVQLTFETEKQRLEPWTRSGGIEA